MQKSCAQCQQQFEIDNDELIFLNKISPTFAAQKFQIPTSVLCPWCRNRRRLAWRNERNLYRRKCDATGKEIITIYSPQSPYTVFDKDYWWSDKFDASEYGREFDYSKPFFDQFKALLLKVPRMALFNTNSENCDYANYIGHGKDCYMTFIAYPENRSVHYSNWVFSCHDSVDLDICHRCELCYECVQCYNAYNCSWCFRCTNCNDCLYSAQLKNCSYCLFSTNLVNKKYYIFNNKYSEKEYFNYLKTLKLGSYQSQKNHIATWKDLISKMIVRNLSMISCEDSLGDNLTKCKNVQYGFDCNDSQDCKYYFGSSGSNMYHSMGGETEWCYEVNNCGVGGSNYFFCSGCINCSNIWYSESCQNCKDCFGCVGLKNRRNCIFNKQFSQEEYEKTVAKIIAHMQKSAPQSGGCSVEWGEYFPLELSIFGYNETMANLHYPLSKEAAQKLNANWREETAQINKSIIQATLSDSIEEADPEILKATISCINCRRAYRFIPQELDFYRKKNVPLPRLCYECRHLERFKFKNPYKLFTRNCGKCKAEIQTTYAPNRPETVYCEKCYLAEIY